MRFWYHNGQVFASINAEPSESLYQTHDRVTVQQRYRVKARFQNIEENTIDLGTVHDNKLLFAAKWDPEFALHDINMAEFTVPSANKVVDPAGTILNHLMQTPKIHNPALLNHPDRNDGVVDAADYIMWRNRPEP